MDKTVKKLLEMNNNFTNTFAVGRFPRPKEPRKIKRTFFAEEIKTAIVSAQCTLTELLLNNYAANEYENIEDIIADIHLISAAVLNDFQMTASLKKCKPYKVEDFLPGGRLVSGIKL